MNRSFPDRHGSGEQSGEWDSDSLSAGHYLSLSFPPGQSLATLIQQGWRGRFGVADTGHRMRWWGLVCEGAECGPDRVPEPQVKVLVLVRGWELQRDLGQREIRATDTELDQS